MAYKIPNVTGEFDPEEDAKTLTEAESIHSNPDRHKAAQTQQQERSIAASHPHIMYDNGPGRPTQPF
jgi:hypothetical protein